MAHRKKPVPVIPSNSLVASAVRYSGKSARVYFGGQDWQAECYRHYAICGEARYAARFYGHALSRATLGVGKRVNGRMEWSTTGAAKSLLDELFNGAQGQAQMLEALGVHLAVAGECYLIGRSVTGTDGVEGEVWEIVSVKEIKVTGQKWTLTFGGETADIVLDDDDVVIRIWVPDPVNRMGADSPFRSLLPILTEIEWLTRSIFAQTSSRLIGNGILVVPTGMSFPPPPDKDGKAQEYSSEADGLMLTLANAMEKAMAGTGHAAEKVPIIIQAPGDEIANIRVIQFWSELDAASMDLRNEAIRRFALGMDLPPEAVLGMGSNAGSGGGTSNGVSHWGAWQIEESTIKMHIEPMLDTVVNALTMGFLRPLVTTDEVVGYDTSALRLRPDRSKESIELYDRGELSAKVMLRENGFDEEADAPKDAEYKQWLLKKIASGSATPEQVNAALKELGIELEIEYPQYGGQPALPGGPSGQADEDGEEIQSEDDCDDEYWDCYRRNGKMYRRRKRQGRSRESRPDPSIDDHPSKPRTPGEQSALIAACDGLVWRALEKAGNRVLNAGVRGKNRDRSMEPAEFHVHADVNGDGPKLLEGAFAYAPKVLDGIADAEKVTTTLENYCLALFQAKTEHTKERLTEYLSVHGLAEFGWPPKEPVQPPMTFNINVEGANTPVNVTLPDGLVQMAAPTAPAPTVEVVNNVPIPSVTVENQVNPTPVTVEGANVQVDNHVPQAAPPTVEVAAPNVTVEAAHVTVEPTIEVKPAPVKVMREKDTKPKKTRVLRDSSGQITGTEEVE
jgi:hypothetical protein